jgi:hypothetical protein
MRRYGRFCLLAILLIIAIYFTLPILFSRMESWLEQLQVGHAHTVSTTASTSIVYSIRPKQWLKFALAEQSSHLRIISNAHIKLTDTIVQNPYWTYAISYELLDKKNTMLAKGVYHQYSRVTVFKDTQGELVNNNYYTNKNIVPLDGRAILLGLRTMENAAFLRISLDTINSAVFEAAVRVYVPAKISEHELATSWQRLSQPEKENMAKNSIYPATLLSVNEKRNLLKHQWQAVGPMGIGGRSYQSNTLYTLKEKYVEQELQEIVKLAAGLQADSQHHATIPIPEQGGQLAVTLKALDGSALTSPVALKLQWFGRDKEQNWQQQTGWPIDKDSLDYNIDGGLLVIQPSSPVIVNAYLTTATETKRDISDALLATKAYLTSFGIDFNVLNFQGSPTAMRVDVRRLLTKSITPQDERISYQWLNDKQQIIGQGELSALEQPSLFDRVGNITEGNNISDPLSYYFHLPPQVTRLRLVSSTPGLLVSAYNQPDGFTKTQRIPEDAYVATDAAKASGDQQLSWFPLRAVNDKSLTQQQGVLWVSGQHRPPEDTPDVLAGKYLWQDFLPEGETAAHYVLTDYSINAKGGEEPHTQALANVYCALEAKRDTPITLNATAGLRSVSPELIYLRNEKTPFTAELYLNKKKTLTKDLIGQQGVMRLPEIPLGNQILRLNTNSSGRWLMNYQAQCKGEQYLKRRVFALTANAGLNFIVPHAPEDEVLLARLYSPQNTVERSQIKVDIVRTQNPSSPPASVTSSWTYKNRLYDIRPLPTKAMPVLNTQGQALGNGERFAIPLNNDLPAGTYQVRLTLAKGAAGFIMLSQIKAGVHGQRRFFRENGFEAH